jgi:hypothetical protein
LWGADTAECSNLELEDDSRVPCLLRSKVGGGGAISGGLGSSLDDSQVIGGDSGGTHGGRGSYGSLLLGCREFLPCHLLGGHGTPMSGGGLDRAEGRCEGDRVEASGRSKGS